METSGSEVAYPTIDQIVDVNRRMIKEYGGNFDTPDNIINRDPLEYILTAIAKPVFDIQLFESLKDKASALAHRIIASHVFRDGNKRTGIHVAWEFLKDNGVDVELDPSIEDLSVDIAAGTADRDDLLEWLYDHQGD